MSDTEFETFRKKMSDEYRYSQPCSNVISIMLVSNVHVTTTRARSCRYQTSNSCNIALEIFADTPNQTSYKLYRTAKFARSSKKNIGETKSQTGIEKLNYDKILEFILLNPALLRTKRVFEKISRVYKNVGHEKPKLWQKP